jgi:hypothetical protein
VAACRERFTVTACVEVVRRARREALTDVTARQIALDDAERQRRAEVRRRRIERKQARRAAAEQQAASAAKPPAASAAGPAPR